MDRYTGRQIACGEIIHAGAAVHMPTGKKSCLRGRVGHTRLVHGHLLHGDPTSIFTQCGVPLAPRWNDDVVMIKAIHTTFMVRYAVFLEIIRIACVKRSVIPERCMTRQVGFTNHILSNFKCFNLPHVLYLAEEKDMSGLLILGCQ
jgi:hypothetical protein